MDEKLVEASANLGKMAQRTDVTVVALSGYCKGEQRTFMKCDR
jgi:hypothetical protein